MTQRQPDLKPITGADFLEGGNGMSLRDYFAAQALSGVINMHTQSLLLDYQAQDVSRDQMNFDEIEGLIARDAYNIAEAMLQQKVNPTDEP